MLQTLCEIYCFSAIKDCSAQKFVCAALTIYMRKFNILSWELNIKDNCTKKSISYYIYFYYNCYLH